MGWSSGGLGPERVAEAVQAVLDDQGTPKEVARAAVEAAYEAARDQDWDTCDESFGTSPLLDEVLNEKGWGVDEDEEED